MSPSPTPLLAVQVDGVEFALEPGRSYTLGSHADCDLRLPGAPQPIALRIALGDGVATVQPTGGRPHALAIGDGMQVAGLAVRVVADSGTAMLLPIPALRAARQASAAAMATTPAAGAAVPVDLPRTGAFADLMASELRRAPWLTLSLLLHAVLLLALLWLFPARANDGTARATYGFLGSAGPDATPAAATAPPLVVAEPAEAVDVALPEPTPPTPTTSAANTDAAPTATPDLRALGNERVAARRSGGGGSAGVDLLAPAGGGAASGAFRRTVADLRQSGLEVAFVIDSTGSMDRSIAAAKDGIASMLELLRALVPDARFCVVAFRDRGAGEDYLVRLQPLSRDFYAAVNFVQSIDADGGGDVPEAVRDALLAAFRQPWADGARRVVVLAGDAPPHRDEQRALLDDVRRFARGPRTFVHTLITNAEHVDAAADQAFRRIADQGHGVHGTVADHSRILRDVLSLAFGREYAPDLEALQERLAAARRSPPTWALQLARSGGAALARALATDPVPPELVHALLRLPRATVSAELAALLGERDLPAPGRQAVAHVLQRQLGLERVPIDPERPAAVFPHVVAQLQDLCRHQLPR